MGTTCKTLSLQQALLCLIYRNNASLADNNTETFFACLNHWIYIQ